MDTNPHSHEEKPALKVESDSIVKYKRCVKCGVMKEVNKSNFYVRRTYADGLSATCKVCEYKREKEIDGALFKFRETKNECVICGKLFSPVKRNQVCCGHHCSEIKKSRHGSGYNHYRMKVFVRDDFRCIYCGLSSIEDNAKLTIDHVYPRSKKGKNDIFNIVTSCSLCNLTKHSRILSKELILSIWKRNIEKDKKSGLFIEYDEMKTFFNEHFKIQDND